MGIPSDLNKQLQDALQRCGPFERDIALRALFTDARIDQWRDDIPCHADLSQLAEALAETLRFQTTSSASRDASEWDAELEDYYAWVQQRYGTTRLFGQTHPIPLDDIFTDVYILEAPAARRRHDIQKLRTEPERLSQANRVRGRDMIQRESGHRLMILGHPGAGKTTFLKYVALEAAKGNIAKVPMFVRLRTWAADGRALLDFAEFAEDEHRGLRELGQTPLLLGLLCLTFDEMGTFPLLQDCEIKA